MENWTSACYKHFKLPVIIEDKGETKYQCICKTYVPFFFSLTFKLTYQKPTEIPLSSSHGNARRIPQPIFSAMSNLAKVKLLANQRVLPVTHMGPYTTRPNCDTSSRFGRSSAIGHSQSSKIPPSSGSSRCWMRRPNCHLRQQSHEMSRRSTASRRSMLGKSSRFARMILNLDHVYTKTGSTELSG